VGWVTWYEWISYLGIEYRDKEETKAQTTGKLKMFASSKQNAGPQL
jgi:hypothetical protein